MKKEVYVSVAVACDGNCPGVHSALSFGAVALDASLGIDEQAVVSTFCANVLALPGASPDLATMDWWNANRKRYNECQEGAQEASLAMERFASWVDSLPGQPVFVGDSTSLIFSFWYSYRFVRRHLFAGSVDVGSYVMAITGSGYMELGKRSWPAHWTAQSVRPKAHVMVEEATDQGFSFLRIMNDRRSKVWGSPLGDSRSCPVCVMPGGSILDGPHTFGADCLRRKFV